MACWPFGAVQGLPPLLMLLPETGDEATRLARPWRAMVVYMVKVLLVIRDSTNVVYWSF
jgi:hypothetical protein